MISRVIQIAVMRLYFDTDFSWWTCKSYMRMSGMGIPDLIGGGHCNNRQWQPLKSRLRRTASRHGPPLACSTSYNNQDGEVPVQKEAKPANRRVYINQRILRLRAEVKGLQKELQDATAAARPGPGAPKGDGSPKGPKANHIKIYARERLGFLRDELKSLTAERKSLPQKQAPAQKSESPQKPASPQKSASASR